MTINLDKMKSRKLWTMLGALAVIALNSKLGLGIPDTVIQILSGSIPAYLIGQGIADTAKKQ